MSEDLPEDTQQTGFSPEAIAAFEKAAATGNGEFTLTSGPSCTHQECHISTDEAQELAWNIYGLTCAVMRHQWDKDGRPPRRLTINVKVTASAD